MSGCKQFEMYGGRRRCFESFLDGFSLMKLDPMPRSGRGGFSRRDAGVLSVSTIEMILF